MEGGEARSELLPQFRVEVGKSLPEFVLAPPDHGRDRIAAGIGQGKKHQAAVFGRSGALDIPSRAQPVGKPRDRGPRDFKDMGEGAAGQRAVVVKGEQHAHLRQREISDLVNAAHGDGEQVARGALESVDLNVERSCHTASIA